MNKMIRSILICLVFILLFSFSACGNTEIEQKSFTFMPQETQPIEENPFVLPMEISSELGLHKLDVQKPDMAGINNSDEVVSTILGSAHQVANLHSTDLVNSVLFGNPVTFR